MKVGDLLLDQRERSKLNVLEGRGAGDLTVVKRRSALVDGGDQVR